MYTTTTLAKAARVSRSTVERAIKDDKLAAVQVGRSYAIEDAEAERWLAAHRPYEGLRGPRARRGRPAGG